MNKIKISYVKTIYNYLEYYWTIDDKLIVEYLDFYTKKGLCPKLKSMGTMMGLSNNIISRQCSIVRNILF
jgi:hypothetical protein